jgi:hypothetical protein
MTAPPRKAWQSHEFGSALRGTDGITIWRDTAAHPHRHQASHRPRRTCDQPLAVQRRLESQQLVSGKPIPQPSLNVWKDVAPSPR